MPDIATTDTLIERFLAKVEKEPPTRPRLIFAIDATASRQPTWDLASQVQSQMFLEAAKHGGLEVQLVYYRGFDEMKATAWFSSSRPLVNAMTGIMCQAGYTQINRVLAHVGREHRKAPVAAVVLIGDAFEEAMVRITSPMPPAYCFLEGNNPHAMRAFENIARETKGAVLPFDANSPNQLKELLGAVAAFVTGGATALADHRPEIVALLTNGGAS